MGDGSGFTVATAAIVHPAVEVYVIVVVSADIPYRIPELLPIVAAAVLELVQVPPAGSVRVVFDPAHTNRAPPMAEGSGLTVTTAMEKHPPVANL